MRISTAAVGLAGKSLAVLLEDRELQRAAGYDDNDVRLAGQAWPTTSAAGIVEDPTSPRYTAKT